MQLPPHGDAHWQQQQHQQLPVHGPDNHLAPWGTYTCIVEGVVGFVFGCDVECAILPECARALQCGCVCEPSPSAGVHGG